MRQNLTHRIFEQSALNPKLTFVIISKKVLATWPEEAKIKNTATPTRKIYNKFKGVYLRGAAWSRHPLCRSTDFTKPKSLFCIVHNNG